MLAIVTAAKNLIFTEGSQILTCFPHPLPTIIVEFSCEILHFLLKLFVHLMRYILDQLRCKGRLSSLCAYLFVDAVI